MNTELILKRLPSYPLLQSELIESLSIPGTHHLLKKFGLEDAVDEDSDLEDLQAVLFAFLSSYDGLNVEIFHRLYEFLAVFPELGFEIVQSLLESTEGIVSKTIIELAAELQEHISADTCDSVSITTTSVTQLVDTDNENNICHTFDRKTVLIITDDGAEEGGDVPSRHVVGVAMSKAYGLNTLYSMQELYGTRRPYLEWGLNDLHVCYRGASDTAKGEENGELSIVTKQVYVTSVVFEYSHCLERMFDLFHYGWASGKGGAGGGGWTPALEEAMLHLLISVDDDLVMFVRWVVL
jgi:hypothetical protein